MKLLIITRKVDVHDDRMGFFVDWINEFANNLSHLYVISMQDGGKEGLAKNIDIRFVGGGKLKKYFTYKRLLNELVPNVDGVFVHMMPLYANLAGPVTSKFDKKLLLWYMHRSVDKELLKTRRWVSGYVTASKKSFRMETDLPVHIVGHAIPTERLKISSHKSRINNANAINILTIGRISPAKRLETIIKSIDFLANTYKLLPNLTIVGAPALDKDENYLNELKKLVKSLGLENVVEFVGPKQHKDIPGILNCADIFVNASDTGSLDKAVLEAMVAGVVPLTSNEAFKSLFSGDLDELMFPPGDSHALAQKISDIHGATDEQLRNIRVQLISMVERDHNLKNTIKKIINLF